MSAPFVWPNSFKVTDVETSKTNPGAIFTNAYVQDGLKARNQFYKDGAFHVDIVRLDERRELELRPDGTVHQVVLSTDLPRSNLFPKNRPWELIGPDVVNGIPALKYKTVRGAHKLERADKTHEMLVWLTTDNKTPLRMEVEDSTIDFLNYSPGPQDKALFEVVK